MSSHYYRKRSHSRESSHNSSKTKKRNKFSSNDNLEMLNNILASLNELKCDISSRHTRISKMESLREHNEDTDSQRETTRSIAWARCHLPAGNVEGDPLVADVLQNTAIKPTNTAIKPRNAKNGLEVVDETQHFASGLHDPETLASSWSTSENLALTLPKNKLGCLRFSRL